jgi:xanthine dehydrogenase molybdenum-binding subunit
MHGGLGAAGLDSAIFEETVQDRSLGRALSSNLIDYKWRTFEELPDFQTVILETPFEASHRFKAIGVGEITTAPGPSAILMAISNAIGMRMFDYPITPTKILSALGKLPGGKA